MTTESVVELSQEEIEDMASLEHGAIGARLLRFLDVYVEEHELGLVFNAQTTFKVEGTPSKRYPDIAFVMAERLPENLRVEADFAPDLAVEVVSKNDTDFEIEERIIQYQNSGVRLIWIIHPVSQSVEIYRLSRGIESERLSGDKELDGEDVIPGFKLRVSKLFALPGRKPKTGSNGHQPVT